MILTEVGIPWFLDLMNSKDEDQVNATQYVFQTLLNTLAGMNIKKGKKADNALLGGMGSGCLSLLRWAFAVYIFEIFVIHKWYLW